MAVALDLTNKSRHLAETADGRAKAAIKNLDRAIDAQDIAELQLFERSLLQESEATLDRRTSGCRQVSRAEHSRALVDERGRRDGRRYVAGRDAEGAC